MTQRENFVRLLQRAAKAMKYSAQFFGIRPNDFKSVVPRIALMNDDVQPELRGEIELLFEKAGLFRFVSAVVDLRLQLLFRRGL